VVQPGGTVDSCPGELKLIAIYVQALKIKSVQIDGLLEMLYHFYVTHAQLTEFYVNVQK